MPLKIFSCRVTRVGPVSVPLPVLGSRYSNRRTSVVVTHFVRGKQHPAVYLVIAGNTGRVFTVSSRCGGHTSPHTTTWNRPRFLHLGPATVEHLLEGQQTIRMLALTTFFLISLFFLSSYASNNYGSM